MIYCSYEELEDNSTPTSFERWEEYFFDQCIEPYIVDGILHASVQGSEKYIVTMTPDHKECSCPYHYEWRCKHIVAVWLQYLEDIESENNIPTLDANKCINERSLQDKNDLIHYITHYSPELLLAYQKIIKP